VCAYRRTFLNARGRRRGRKKEANTVVGKNEKKRES